MPKKWILPPPAPNILEYASIVPWVARTLRENGLLLPTDPRPLTHLMGQLLAARGILASDAPRYFECTDANEEPLHMRGMAGTVARLRAAIRANEEIAVYGDYDVDGVTATALMVSTLRALGGNVRPYIPHRVDEGYGLQSACLDTLKNQGVRLVLSVDCGVRAAAEAAHARAIGLDLLISDHHTVPEHLPDAIVINPLQQGCEYGFKYLSGVGIAYKIAQALLAADQRDPLRAGPSAMSADSLLDLVALGTVADVVPLRGENRSLVHRGLKILNDPPRIGVRALILKSGFKLGSVDSYTIGFGLGPRLNAAGRLEHARLSYELLMTGERLEAESLATRLDAINRERQELMKTCVAHARAKVVAEQDSSPIIFAADASYPQGIVGLVASRLAEEFYRPALVMEWGAETSKGSARTIPEFNIVEALDECSDILLRHGGHRAAAGFTLETARLPELHARLSAIAHRQFNSQPLSPALRVDAEVSFAELDRTLLFLLERMQPFGAENPSPVFIARGVNARSTRVMGKDGDHLRLSLEQNLVIRSGVAFRQAKQWAGQMPPRIDVAFAFEWNEYNGERTMQLNVKDIRPARCA
jgi:single-stranded-DNA-specific exonuclease